MIFEIISVLVGVLIPFKSLETHIYQYTYNYELNGLKFTIEPTVAEVAERLRTIYNIYNVFFFGEKYDTIIVGGGIAGLFLAYKLKDTKQDILLIERKGEWGGRIHTIYKTDYHYDQLCAAARI